LRADLCGRLKQRIVFGEHCQKLRDRQRLRQVIVTPGSQALIAVAHHRVSGHGNNRRLQAILAQNAHNFQAADRACKLNIHQDQIIFFMLQFLQRNLALGI
jgi:hypothetical protein